MTALALGWLLPGGGYLPARRYGMFAAWFVLVCSTFALGLWIGGGGMWVVPQDLKGLDGLASVMAWAGVASRMLTGAPYIASWLAGHLPGYVQGRLHEFGSTLTVSAGLLNLLAMASAKRIK